jgi:hypothetical protein
MTVRIYADQENNAERFWDNFEKLFPVAACQIRRDGYALVTDEQWSDIKKIRGFAEGPQHAANALNAHQFQYSDIAEATLEQLKEELAAAGYDSMEIDLQAAQKSVRFLFLEAGKAETRMISVTWGNGKLHAECEEEQTLSSSVVRWPDPITEDTNPWSVAYAVTRINGAELASVEHSGKCVYVHVFA